MCSERSSLYSRSVLMLPDPTIAAVTVPSDTTYLLRELQTDRTESGELGMESISGTRVDGARAGTGQDHIARLQPHSEARDLAGQPRHRDDGIAEHRIAAAFGDDLTVAGEHRVD